MAKYRLHCFAQSGNSYKVALYLNCAGLNWEPFYVDFFGGATRSADYRSGVNEMGETPVLEIGGRRLTQSGAILTWLADETGQFSPDQGDARYEALRWILFDNHKFTSYLATYRYMRSLAPHAPNPDVLAFFKGRVDGNFAIVDKHLQSRIFVTGDRPTIADFSLAGYLFYPSEETGYDLKTSFPSIHAWTERLKGLKGWRDPYELMPGKRFLAER